MLTIDGSFGEGGGQVLRSSLALSVISGKPVQIERIRAGRRKPGLKPQHLTCVRAAARICNASTKGAKLNSQELTFEPRTEAKAGTYTFDVAQAAKGGSAGSVSLVLQTVLLPLALADGTSQITLRGGTHVAWSPPFDYVKRVYLPTLSRLGVSAKSNLLRWGWYPLGGGEVKATVEGSGPDGFISGLDLGQRGSLVRVRGISASSNLPKHIRTRQERSVLQMLRSHSLNARIEVIDAPSKGQGTVVFLWAEFENAVAGFTSLGELGKPAEQVAEQAALDLLDYLRSGAALDRHLADQIILPLALAGERACFSTACVTHHMLTNAWVVDQFFPGRIQIVGQAGEPGSCSIVPE